VFSILNTRKHKVSETGLFPSSDEERKKHIVLSPLQRANLSVDKIHKHNNSEYYPPSLDIHHHQNYLDAVEKFPFSLISRENYVFRKKFSFHKFQYCDEAGF
jgi:hypothetical protein